MALSSSPMSEATLPASSWLAWFAMMMGPIPAGLGCKLARPESEVVSIVGDGTYQMLPMELATVVQENIKVIYVLLQNYGFCSIGSLSESRGS